MRKILKTKTTFRTIASVFAVTSFFIAGVFSIAGPAYAINGASLDLNYGALVFDANPGDPLIYDADLTSANSNLSVGFNKTYVGVATIDGVIVNAKVTTLQVTGMVGNELNTFDQYDNSANFSFHAMPSGGGESSGKFRIEFFDSVTNVPVVIKNIRASIADIDAHEFARFFSPSTYTLSAPTSISATTSSGNTTFYSSDTGTSATDQTRIAQVEYATASYIDFTAGCRSGASGIVGAGGTCGFTVNFASALTGATSSVSVAPRAVDDTYTTSVNTPVSGSANALDTFPVNSTFAKITEPTHGTVAWNVDGTFTYSPNAGFSGVDSFIYEITAPNGTKSVATETITVEALAVAVNDSYRTLINTPVNGVAGTGDTYPTGSTFAKTTSPAHGTVVWNNNGTYVYTPATGWSGVDAFTYTITTPGGQTVTATETITVQALPLAVSDSYVTALNTPVNGDAGTGDSYSAGSTFAQTSSPAHGTVVWNSDGTYVYTPTTGWSGVDTFTYEVTGPDNNTDTATETITVEALAIAANDSLSTDLNVSVNGAAATGDTYPAGTTFAKTSNPAHGTVVWNVDGTYVYTPNSGWSGVDTFTYSFTTPGGQTMTATETITVRAASSLGSGTPNQPSSGVQATGLAQTGARVGLLLGIAGTLFASGAALMLRRKQLK